MSLESLLWWRAGCPRRELNLSFTPWKGNFLCFSNIRPLPPIQGRPIPALWEFSFYGNCQLVLYPKVSKASFDLFAITGCPDGSVKLHLTWRISSMFLTKRNDMFSRFLARVCVIICVKVCVNLTGASAVSPCLSMTHAFNVWDSLSDSQVNSYLCCFLKEN